MCDVQFEELKQDFQYNLQLLSDRDAELERYDASTAELTAALEQKTQNNTDLKAALAQAQSGE